MATKLGTSSRLITTNLCMVGNPLTSIKNSFEHPFRKVYACVFGYVCVCLLVCVVCVCVCVVGGGGGRGQGRRLCWPL